MSIRTKGCGFVAVGLGESSNEIVSREQRDDRLRDDARNNGVHMVQRSMAGSHRESAGDALMRVCGRICDCVLYWLSMVRVRADPIRTLPT